MPWLKEPFIKGHKHWRQQLVNYTFSTILQHTHCFYLYTNDRENIRRIVYFIIYIGIYIRNIFFRKFSLCSLCFPLSISIYLFLKTPRFAVFCWVCRRTTSALLYSLLPSVCFCCCRCCMFATDERDNAEKKRTGGLCTSKSICIPAPDVRALSFYKVG